MKKQTIAAGLLVFILAGLILNPVLAPPPAVAGEEPYPGINVLVEVLNYLTTQYVSEIDPGRLISGAIKGAVSTLGDPYTSYMDAQEFSRYMSHFEGSFGGIGIRVNVEGDYIKIVEPLQGTPGERAGLKAGDLIIGVDGKDMKGVGLDEAIALMRGEPGTEVVLTVQRGDQTLEFRIVRGIIRTDRTNITTEIIDGEIGYLKLDAFIDNSAPEVRLAVADLKARGIKALILDLRDNPGGLLDQAVEVAGAFVPPGTVVQIVTRGAEPEPLTASGGPLGLPLAVLVNGGSASASEIVAGAIQDYGTGVLVGTRTYGKGLVQSLVGLSDGSALKLTTAVYLTPNGRSLNGTGLVPDIEVSPTNGRSRPLDSELLPLVGTRVLRQGIVGLDVFALQQRLNVLGFSAGVEDGIFGPKTAAALKAFQSSRGLDPTSVLDPATFKALQEALRPPETPQGDLQKARAVEVLKDAL